MSLTYLLICANNPTLERQNHFRNICVRTQNTVPRYLLMCANNPALEISSYVCRKYPCAEMIQITSSLARIYAQTPILYSMDLFALCADNPQKQAFQCTHKQKLRHRMVCALRKNSKFGSIHTSNICLRHTFLKDTRIII